MLKLNKLLYLSAPESDVFLNRIVPTSEQRQVLVDAKNAIRDHLRPRITAATTAVLGIDHAVEPRFRTQGSWSYKTCVQPPSMPPQEMDWDYGLYLPVSVWQDNGTPTVMAKVYFKLVEDFLKELCDKRGWYMVDGEKSTCIRVHISKTAHIDLPLYAAPEDQFNTIVEKISLEARLAQKDSVALDEYIDEDAQKWEHLTTISLATREGEWWESDPEAVSTWYLDRVLEHREQLRRVSRYLKAWRDFHWKNGGPSSVLIMIIVARAFERFDGRDDRALETAAALLARDLRGDVREEGIDEGKEDFNGLDEKQREVAAAKAKTLHDELHRARMMRSSWAQTAVDIMREQLGDRLPNRVDLVEADSGDLLIRDVPARMMPPPVVPSTSAG